MKSQSFATLATTACALVAALAVTSAGAVSVVGVSPQGQVAKARQVVVRFSEAVVAFGDPRLPDPYSVECTGKPAGSGRWVSDRAWGLGFPRGGAARRDVRDQAARRLEAGSPPPRRAARRAKTSSAAALTGTTAFTFSTGGPSITEMQPGSGGDRRGPALPHHRQRPGGRSDGGEERLVRGRGRRASDWPCASSPVNCAPSC